MTTTVVCGPAAGPRPHVARYPAIGWRSLLPRGVRGAGLAASCSEHSLL